MIHPFDQEIKTQIQQEPTPAVPDFIHAMTEATLADLPEKAPAHRTIFFPLKRLTAAAACAGFLMLGLLPNISSAYAQAVEPLPVIGSIVRVLTIRNYFYEDEGHLLEAAVPSISDPTSTTASDLINADIDRLTGDAIGHFYTDLELSDEGHGSIHIDYDVLCSTDHWFTLQLMVSETAGSSDNQLRYYHIDRTTGHYVTFGDLFTADGYDAMEDYILKEMTNRMAADPDAAFWIDEEGITVLSEDQPFYFTEEGTLTIVYDKYTVAPGSMGNPIFEIPEAFYTKYLKARVSYPAGIEQ